ncbi:type II secretory pathway, ATPase PulE/Tfp pilus assembly pathway, ATPase PilB [Synechococcus sp. PCC 7502]|uniref:GspE/PulE family protein n=1 Tax=Synechococcus sp. PCC 7502 TaxID=1173263 RepID=UPI00029FB21A|nr:GspE/PulE family protein [Synechococcus sp. PCC 7502]AFY72400.1 type II secretory pathway, ATPase PulE/Tfp pilus assembly pathway, ATPase PilB [Synechococcus sp. PCC 7502]
MSSSHPLPSEQSVWKQLRCNHLFSCDEALRLLVDPSGRLNINGLDAELNHRFFQKFEDRNSLPPVVPLLLWQSCFYLGSPVEISDDILKKISDRTLTAIKIIPIASESYRAWFRTQNLPDPKNITSNRLINPLTGETEEVDIREVTDLYLSQAANQTRRINALISVAMQHRASDIHLEPTEEGLRFRCRIDGILRDIKTLPLEVSRRIIVALKVMCNMDIAESRRPQDGRIGRSYTEENTESANLDMRVSTLPCVNGEKVVIRLLPRRNPFTGNIQGLGFTPRALQTYSTWLQQPQGLIIMTGPTGSGKTSTLYTSLQMIATEHVNVVTVEDPVEYILPNITQTQVHELAGMTFAAGLRAILRQDPDIVMVGEVRDPETAETVIRAALTGHLVLSTMHTNDAASAIPRLKDLGPDPGLISDALLGIVAQRLVRKVCPHCAQPHIPSDTELMALTLSRSDIGSNWRKGKGCEKCLGSGYLGREAVVELLDVNDHVRRIIYEGNITQMNRYLSEIDFDSFRLAAIDKVIRGVTTVEEVTRVLPRSALVHRSVFVPRQISNAS